MSTRSARSTFSLTVPTTEREVVEALAYRMLVLFRHATAINNTTVYGWESDLLTVTRAGIVHEFEVKVDRSDLLGELRALGDAKLRRSDSVFKRGRARTLRGLRPSMKRPNHFWIATVPDVVATDELPDFVGHVVVNYHHPRFVDVLRSAPKLHPEKVSDDVRAWIERGIALRLWA